MTKLYIREFLDLAATQQGDSVDAVSGDSLADQVVDFTGGVTSSAAFNANTTWIEICGDSGFSYVLGTAPVAAATNFRQPGNVPKRIRITPGVQTKISAITNP